MRPAAWLVIVALLAAAAALTWWQTTPAAFAAIPVPPGQYPLDAPRPEWPATDRTRPYSPAAGMGSDAVAGAAEPVPIKAACGRRPATGCPAPF
jgi:hypothetical protein